MKKVPKVAANSAAGTAAMDMLCSSSRKVLCACSRRLSAIQTTTKKSSDIKKKMRSRNTTANSFFIHKTVACGMILDKPKLA